jgi:DNA polymerase III subunit gamma/tau
MAYEVIARKWRPRQFDDVVGQEHVTRTLRNALTSGRIAHAYLFVGPRGIGKTSIARIFAKALTCETGPTPTPCDACDACREVAAGTNLDVLEIDGASNNGVEQVRDLRETVKFAPARGRFKIYIIDEVHMLSTAAFNALLKTLEEPPSYVKFLFATTEPGKLPATVISRCQRFDLRRIPTSLIVERLRLIAADEKVDIDADALLAVARGSEGGLRDAESALDQLIAFQGKTIREADVLAVFGLVARETLETLAAQVLAGDVKGLVRTVAELDAAGKDLQRLALELLAHFRNLLIVLHVDDPAVCSDLTDAQRAVLVEQARGTDGERVMRITDRLAETSDALRHALSRRVLLDTTLIRCARTAAAVSLESVLQTLQALRSGGAAAPEPAAPAAAPPAAPKKKAVAPPGPAEPARGGDDLARLQAHWRAIVEKVGRIAMLTRGSLVDARPVAVEGDRVVIAFDPEFADEAAKFEQPRNAKALHHALRGVLGREVVVAFAVAGAPPAAGPDARADEDAGADGADEAAACAPVEDAGADAASETPPAARRPLQAWRSEPEVKTIMELFGGDVIEVRDG